MFDTRFEKRLQDILQIAGRDVGDNPRTVAEEAAETYEDHLNILMQRAIQLDNENLLRKKGDRNANNANTSQGSSESNQGGGGGKKKRATSLPCAGNMRGVTKIIFLRMALKEQVARVVERVPSG